MQKPIVDIQNLSFTYSGAVSPTLENVCLQVNPGEFLTITGPSGCGKSTLVLCLAGFIPYAFPGTMAGSVRIQGKDTRDYPAGGLSGIVGLVQQDPEAQLCTLTVLDEVAFGPENLCLPPEEIRERVRFALDAVGIWGLRHRQVHTLSGGEKQRLAIASVLAMTPSLLVLDEPTANLDPHCTREVLQVLERLRREQAVSIIVVEHRLEKLLPLSDRLVIMSEGRITGDGLPLKGLQIVAPCGDIPEMPVSGASSEPDNGVRNGEPILSVENLRVGYAEDDVLSGVDFSLYPGEIVAVMGDNGSGKTTLILTLLGVIKPKEGRIRFRGRDVTSEKVSRRARYMGLTFQNPNHQLFEDTVFKEAALPSSFLSEEPPSKTEYIINALLEKFGLFPYREQNPFTLSLGEKKRLTLVSVLAYGPPILILDEPLVGQDPDRLRLFLEVLRKHRERGGLTIMVCHEPAVVASYCQRILFVDKGGLAIDAGVGEAFRELARRGRVEYLPPGYTSGIREGEAKAGGR